MPCPLCSYDKTHKRSQRFLCPSCKQTFTETFGTLYYHRRLNREQLHTVLQSHVEGSSMRGISRISQLAYGTIVSIVRTASHKAQLIHNALVQQVQAKAVIADEL
jgi:transposase-like protein